MPGRILISRKNINNRRLFLCWVVLLALGDEETIEVLAAAGSGVWDFIFAIHKLFKLFSKQFEITRSLCMSIIKIVKIYHQKRVIKI